MGTNTVVNELKELKESKNWELCGQVMDEEMPGFFRGVKQRISPEGPFDKIRFIYIGRDPRNRHRVLEEPFHLAYVHLSKKEQELRKTTDRENSIFYSLNEEAKEVLNGLI